MKSKFPYEHVVKYDTKEVWILCDSTISAIGTPALVKQYYPGYTGHIGSKEYIDKLRSTQVQF